MLWLILGPIHVKIQNFGVALKNGEVAKVLLSGKEKERSVKIKMGKVSRQKNNVRSVVFCSCQLHAKGQL